MEGGLRHLLGTPLWTLQQEGLGETRYLLCVPMIPFVPMEGSVSPGPPVGTAPAQLMQHLLHGLHGYLAPHPHLFGCSSQGMC